MKALNARWKTYHLSMWAMCLTIAVLLAVPCSLLARVYRQRQLNDSLIGAIKKNDTAVIVSLLRQGADANAKERVDNGLSWWKTIQYYLQSGRLPDVNGDPAIAVAMNVKDYEDPAILKSLLQAGAKTNCRDSRRDGIIAWAVYHADLSLITVALAHGASPNEPTGDDGTALTEAIRGGKNDIALLLLARGADPNSRDGSSAVGLTFVGDRAFRRVPALSCAMVRDPDPPDAMLIAALLKFGADPNAVDDDGHTPLMWGLIMSYYPDAVVPLLLRNGAIVSCRDKAGATALEYAYVRQRDFLHTRNRKRADALAGYMPHVSFSAHADIKDASEIIHQLKQAGAKK